jgi:DNA-binding YbaB/EbfC family protein
LFGNLGNMFSLLTNAHAIGAKMQTMGEELKLKRAKGSSGGGMVEVEVNGLGEVLRVTIDPKLKERGDLELLEDLIPAAVNQAVTKSRELHAESLKGITDGMDIPGLSDMVAKLQGNKP